MFFDEEQDNRVPKNALGLLTACDLQTLSIQELKDRIEVLEEEIERTKLLIVQKESHRSGIENLFGNGG